MTEYNDKIPLKLADLSIKKFNDIAVPNCLGLLKNHKSNIEKSLALGDWNKIKKEEMNATRIVKQLKTILLEIEILRDRIIPEDLEKFDTVTKKSRDQVIEGIREYIDLQLKTPNKSISRASTFDDEVNIDADGKIPQIQIDQQLNEQQMKSQIACLEEFEVLQREIKDLYSIFKILDTNVHEQKEMVDIVAENVDETEVHVEKGESNLRTALKYKKTMYPICGALLGTCVGGPIGFLVGLKAGGLAAVGCGILGFTGGTVLKKQEEEHQRKDPEEKED